MIRKCAISVCLCLLSAVTAAAQEKGAEPKALSGMSIIGNDEAPKSLYLVPWKSSELGVETSLNRMLNEEAMPVDRDVFLRQVDFYAIRTAQASVPAHAGVNAMGRGGFGQNDQLVSSVGGK